MLCHNNRLASLELHWREWEGVEPTYPVLTRHNGFEVRKSHRAPSTPEPGYDRRRRLGQSRVDLLLQHPLGDGAHDLVHRLSPLKDQ